MALPSSAADEPHMAHFLAIPWARDLIQSQNYTVTPSLWRRRKESTEDELLAVSLNTPATIANHLALYRNPSPVESNSSDELKGVREMKLLVTLGPGVNGWPDTCHGGVIATLLDEFMGALINVRRKELAARGHTTSDQAFTMTANLEIAYKAPVKTPATHVLTVEFDRAEGRKLWVKGRIEDDDGKISVTSKALFLLVKPKL